MGLPKKSTCIHMDLRKGENSINIVMDLEKKAINEDKSS
jgi:hypothetical protein